MFNVETILNVYNAINSLGAVTYKYITIAGEVRNPVTLKAPLGITYGELVELAGGATVKDSVLIAGGPMTGRICGPEETVTKTSNAILVMPKDAFIVVKRMRKTSVDVKRAMSACCQCQMCTDLCSRNLLGHPIKPHLFMRNLSGGVSNDTDPVSYTHLDVYKRQDESKIAEIVRAVTGNCRSHNHGEKEHK